MNESLMLCRRISLDEVKLFSLADGIGALSGYSPKGREYQWEALVRVLLAGGSVVASLAGNQIVGYVTLHRPGPEERWGRWPFLPVLELGAIEVARGYRRRGVARGSRGGLLLQRGQDHRAASRSATGCSSGWKISRSSPYYVELCEDLWVPIPPSSYAALAGATVLLNLSASNITIGKADYRHLLVSSQSARYVAAYLYASAGGGESTTDLAWDGHALIYENGTLLGESQRFSYRPQLTSAELDLERLTQDRMRQTSFAQAAQRHRAELREFRTVPVPVELPREGRLLLERRYGRFPYVPSDPGKREQRCSEVFQIQVQGLVKRLKATGLERLVLGVSGGLDSTHALLVCAQAMDLLGHPRTHILAYTMPGFATSPRTLRQAHELMRAIGCEANELDVRPSCAHMLKDIGHPWSEGRAVYDVTFENVQAGERTSSNSILM